MMLTVFSGTSQASPWLWNLWPDNSRVTLLHGPRPDHARCIRDISCWVPEFDRKIVGMYTRGMTARETQGHIGEFHAVRAWHSLILTSTDAAMGKDAAWRKRPLESCYQVIAPR